MITLPSTLVLSAWQGHRHRTLFALGATKAVIAGGCLRDLLLGKPITDIDVFHEGALDDTAELELMDLPKLEGEYEEAIKVYADTSGVWPIQYIQVADVEQRIASFSTPLSQVWLNHEGLVLSAAFIDAVNSKQLRFVSYASEAYRAKIQAKYPEFS